MRSHPASRRQLERLHQTFRTTLLMCTAALPQFGNLKVTKAELDDWYDWFYGEDIAGRRPPPSDTTLLFAERNAWRKIRCGRLSGRSRRRGKRRLALGADPVQAEGQGRQGEVPQLPLSSMAGPLGFQESKGVAYCRDHHLHNKCSGSCGRSHNCPVRKDGWVCDAPPSKHAPQACPHLPK